MLDFEETPCLNMGNDNGWTKWLPPLFYCLFDYATVAFLVWRGFRAQ